MYLDTKFLEEERERNFQIIDNYKRDNEEIYVDIQRDVQEMFELF